MEAAEGTDRLVGAPGRGSGCLQQERGACPGQDYDGPPAGAERELPPQQRLEADLAWGAAASLAGDPAGAEAVRAALGPGNVRSVMESAAPSAACLDAVPAPSTPCSTWSASKKPMSSSLSPGRSPSAKAPSNHDHVGGHRHNRFLVAGAAEACPRAVDQWRKCSSRLEIGTH